MGRIIHRAAQSHGAVDGVRRGRVGDDAQFVLIVDQISPFIVGRVDPPTIVGGFNQRRVGVAGGALLSVDRTDLVDSGAGFAVVAVGHDSIAKLGAALLEQQFDRRFIVDYLPV